MAGNYWQAGTSIFDGRTRRYHHIREGVAAIGGDLGRLAQTKVHDYFWGIAKPKNKLAPYQRGRRWLAQHRKTRYRKRSSSAAHQRGRNPYTMSTGHYNYERFYKRKWAPRRGKYQPYSTQGGRPYRGRFTRRRRNNRTGGFRHIGMRPVISGELKFLDTNLNSEAFTTAWIPKNPTTVNCLNAVPQGTTESSHDGRVYWVHAIFIRGTITHTLLQGAAAPSADLRVRICLVWDTQCNGAELAATEVMDAGAADDLLAFRDLQHSKRFRVLKDKFFQINPKTMSEGGADFFANPATSRDFKWNTVFKRPIKVITDGTGNTVSDISDNAFHIIGIASSTTITLTYECRVRFSG